MKEVIAVDIDDVLVPRVVPILEHLNRRFGRNEDIATMQGESFFTFLADRFADEVDRKELSTIIEDYIVSDAYGAKRPPRDALKGIHELAKNYDLRILSTRPKRQHHITKSWLERYFSGCFTEVVLINEGNFGFNTLQGFSKADYCADHQAVLIDDKLATCRELADRGGRAVLFGEYPWNKARLLQPSITRCKDWVAVVEYFDGR